MLCVLVPCRNEKGNILKLHLELSTLKNVDEIIFVEGGSHDKTYEEIESLLKRCPNSRIRLIKQMGHGKFNAVLSGYHASNADFFVIWDGDNTIPCSDQQKMIDLFLERSQEPVFVTANRITVHREDNAFRFINLIGNFLFSFLVLLVFRVKIPDVLSGTKIFHRNLLHEDITCNRALEADPFGDLYLLSRASKVGCEILSIPCKYKERTYGISNIGRWSGGLAMLKLMWHFLLHSCARRDNPGKS
jgi:glycosyltransferase involved in cell wall biosynthesis